MNEYKEYRIYKPNKAQNGAASQLQLKIIIGEYNKRQGMLFWEMAPQKGGVDADGNAQFDWENKLNMKLSIADIGELLAVLNRKKLVAGTDKGLYHQNEKGNAVLLFRYYAPDNGDPMFTAQISVKRDNKLSQVKHTFTLGESEILKVLLQAAVGEFYGW